MKEIESIASALFDKIRSRFASVTLGDERAKAVTDPEKARFFNFTYSSEDGTDFGKVTISLIDETSLKIYFGQNISEGMGREQRLEWFDFLRNLRHFAKRNLLTFDTRDINKSNLDLKDVKQQSKADTVSDIDDVTVTESKMYGSSHRSYTDHGKCKLLIKHNAPVNDDVRGARARHIQEIFLETDRGERFLLPFTNLHGARAMAQHLTQGGNVHDEIGEDICRMVSEMKSMTHFVRNIKHRQFEDRETAELAQAAIDHYEELKRNLKLMRKPGGYTSYKETMMSLVPTLTGEDVDLDQLRERFVKKVYDDRFEEALPIVYRAYKKRQNGLPPVSYELEEWAETVLESDWTRPDNPDKVRALQELLKHAVPTGIDGMDAQAKIEPIIGSDDLNDAIHALSQSQGVDVDTRPLIKSWLRQHQPELLDQLEFGANNQDNSQTNFAPPVSPPVQNNEFGSGPSSRSRENEMTYENSDPLDFIKSLAGLKR